jgi:two-component SAPR family response regulator
MLGAFTISHGDETVSSLRAARLQALFAYLLLHRAAPQTRQRIASEFWPETSDAQAHTNLRQLLHTLRQRLPTASTYLLVDEHTVAWRGDAPYTLDVAEFQAVRQPMRYLALMAEKPHLLVDVKNNLGAETKVQYAPSAKFYLDDKRHGRPWITFAEGRNPETGSLRPRQEPGWNAY